MLTRARQTGRLPACFVYVTMLGLVLFVSFTGRGTARVAEPGERPDGELVDFVDRDLDAIRETNRLRVLIENSSSSYYILRGEEYGFEFELARQIADELGVDLQVVLPVADLTPVEMLSAGLVDVIAMPLLPGEHQSPRLALTVPYNTVQQRLVVHRAQADRIQSLTDLDGLRVAAKRFSGGERELARLRRLGIDVVAVLHGPEVPQEQVLDLVADGTYPAAVALDVEVEAAQRFREELVTGAALGPRKEVRWGVRSNAPELLAALDHALTGHVRRTDAGRLVRSAFYNIVRARYFEDAPRIDRHQSDPFLFARTGRISPYDDLFRRAARDTGLDWRLLAALAFQESRFDPTAVSWAGAHGLMQLRPRTAGTDPVSLQNPEVNVPIGARHLATLFARYADVPEPERTRFALAAYNCGEGHLDDARRLSSLLGRDPDVWEGSVRESLLLLRQPNFHRMVRYGYVRGHETVAYVREIEQRFELLQTLARRTPTTRFASTGGGGGAITLPSETSVASSAPSLD